MNRADAKAAILRDWMALPFHDRQTDAQVATFAMEVKDRHPFWCSGSRYQIIKGWLQRQKKI